MPRLLKCVIAIAALSVAAPSLAADYNDFPELRPSYPDSWEQGEDNPLRFEAGLRYWYSIGQQTSQLGVGGTNFSTTDRSHILEGHFRIDDDSTNSFVKGQAGYAVVTTGEHSTNVGVPQDFTGGQIGYIGADFGWVPLGGDTVKFGALAGYEFKRESPDRNRFDVQNIDGLNIHALRLGITGRADISEMFDVEAELVAMPYAYATGATAEIGMNPAMVGGLLVNRGNSVATGALYGGSAQLMLGIHPSENVTVRVGGRGWLLEGPSSMRQKYWNSSNPSTYVYSDDLLNGFSLVRYGLMAELTGRF
jgi:hypothetical protein